MASLTRCIRFQNWRATNVFTLQARLEMGSDSSSIELYPGSWHRPRSVDIPSTRSIPSFFMCLLYVLRPELKNSPISTIRFVTLFTGWHAEFENMSAENTTRLGTIAHSALRTVNTSSSINSQYNLAHHVSLAVVSLLPQCKSQPN